MIPSEVGSWRGSLERLKILVLNEVTARKPQNLQPQGCELQNL